MEKISKSTFQFLSDLKKNNDKNWFNANKARYETAKEEFVQFVDALISRIGIFDPKILHQTGKNCVFRIYRDVRFSKDKSPYKTNFGAHITSAAKKSEIHSRAGYYIHLEPGESILAGGAYLPQGNWLKAIRKEIAYNGEELREILNNKSFKQYFGEIEGEKLKTAPRDYPADHPEIELLKYKSFLAVNKCPNDLVLSDNFLEHSANTFEALYPFDQFLNNSLDLE